MRVPFLNLESTHKEIKKKLKNVFLKTLDNNYFINGNEVSNFEIDYAKFNEVKYCIGVSNGLDALFLSLKVLNIKRGDEVIIPSNTFIATAFAISNIGARPVFVEPNYETYNINPDSIHKAITKKTKAIIPVHLYGQSCEMDKIMSIANDYQLYVIEDNAQSQGARFLDRLTGSWGNLNATSFYPGKNLGALGDAGAITTNSELFASKVRSLKNYGSSKKYFNDFIGNNMRIDEIQAGFLRVKLSHLANNNSKRLKIANYYTELLKNCEFITLPRTHTNSTHVYHLYVIRTNFRDELKDYLSIHGIDTIIHYPIPPHLQNAYTHLGFKKGDFPISENLADTCISLPIWPGMKKNQIEYVSEHIINFFKKK